MKDSIITRRGRITMILCKAVVYLAACGCMFSSATILGLGRMLTAHNAGLIVITGLCAAVLVVKRVERRVGVRDCPLFQSASPFAASAVARLKEILAFWLAADAWLSAAVVGMRMMPPLLFTFACAAGAYASYVLLAWPGRRGMHLAEEQRPGPPLWPEPSVN